MKTTLTIIGIMFVGICLVGICRVELPDIKDCTNTNWPLRIEDSIDVAEFVFSFHTLSIGPVTICCTNGVVIIEDGVTMDEASREFWKRLSDIYPAYFPKPFQDKDYEK